MAADFPSNIWIRDPIIEGRKIKGGGLNRGMELLAQARDEITAIETALGTDPAGSVTNLLTRLAVRHARSGLPRGKVQAVPEPSAGWFSVNGLNYQFGITGVVGTSVVTIFYPTSYTVAPSIIVANYVAHATDLFVGESQVVKSSIGTSSFQVQSQNFNSTNVWGAPTLSNRCYIHWVAIGGS
jgi:hypothetical protein